MASQKFEKRENQNAEFDVGSGLDKAKLSSLEVTIVGGGA